MPHPQFTPDRSRAVVHAARRRGRSLLTTVAMLAVTSTTALAQPGTLTFGGSASGDVPTLDFNGGPVLDFSSRILDGFGNQSVLIGGEAQWWTDFYSGEGMVFGNSGQTGAVLELRLATSSGFDLMLDQALFGGWINTARHVSYRLFSDDYSQSTSLQTVLTGFTTPGLGSFATNGWGSAIRLQFSETDEFGAALGRGPFDVGIQDISYTVDNGNGPPMGVPEPGAIALLATGFAGLGVVVRRRRATLA